MKKPSFYLIFVLILAISLIFIMSLLCWFNCNMLVHILWRLIMLTCHHFTSADVWIYRVATFLTFCAEYSLLVFLSYILSSLSSITWSFNSNVRIVQWNICAESRLSFGYVPVLPTDNRFSDSVVLSRSFACNASSKQCHPHVTNLNFNVVLFHIN